MIRLFELRTAKGWSQREIAAKLFVSQGTYNNWENGKTQPSIEQLILLSKLFDESIDYIVGNTDDAGIRKAEPIQKVETQRIIEEIQNHLNALKEKI